MDMAAEICVSRTALFLTCQDDDQTAAAYPQDYSSNRNRQAQRPGQRTHRIGEIEEREVTEHRTNDAWKRRLNAKHALIDISVQS